ncbi:hypothetical protein DICVIV_10484 [Dictyocaulus viviparus]|uniref:Ubiquitin-like domain-containing protein n=1 Tax=Dictyocaulus viviparus TaxID=29172 RepID=A0A0D8XIA2_DICVI|nr:hypothetical protein DICVIV_10484 [Dictyocaulus viviparus]
MNDVTKVNGDALLNTATLSDSDEELYTSSIDIRKVRAVVDDNNILKQVTVHSDVLQDDKPHTLEQSDDDSDSLELSEPENSSPTKLRKLRRKRIERMEHEDMLELEEILSDPVIQVASPLRKKAMLTRSRKPNLQECPEIVLDDSTSLIEEQVEQRRASCDAVVVDLGKEVNLFVTVCVDQGNGRPGKFMTIRQDEPFDSLRPIFAKELNCSQLDVLIHVNKVDAGPGDTPHSMGLDINKLAVVNVFSLKSNSNIQDDLSTNPNFIPVKCVFANVKPRCAYISMTEPFYMARKRIRKQLKLSHAIEKVIFDNEVINDTDSPESLGLEAEDVIDIHLVS